MALFSTVTATPTFTFNRREATQGRGKFKKNVFFSALSKMQAHHRRPARSLCPSTWVTSFRLWTGGLGKRSTMPDSPADVKTQSRLTPPAMPPPPSTQGAPRNSSYTPTTREYPHFSVAANWRGFI